MRLGIKELEEELLILAMDIKKIREGSEEDICKEYNTNSKAEIAELVKEQFDSYAEDYEDAVRDEEYRTWSDAMVDRHRDLDDPQDAIDDSPFLYADKLDTKKLWEEGYYEKD